MSYATEYNTLSLDNHRVEMFKASGKDGRQSSVRRRSSRMKLG